MLKNLTPRSIAALAVVAASFCLMICVAKYGGGALVDPKGIQAAGFAARVTASLVETVGAGIWVLLLVPMVWGVIVYFQERTPDLLMRFVGTVVLAVATSTLVGLSSGGPWAGHVGNGVAGALGGLSGRLGGFGTALAWLVDLALFAVSLAFATDWLFHTVRRESRAAANEPVVIAVEPPVAALLDNPAEAEPRAFVVETPRAAVAAAELSDSVGESSAEAATPRGWDETEDEGRTVISAPTGYRGVEFLPPSDEFATPEAPLSRRIEMHSDVVEHDASEELEPLWSDEEFVATSDAAYFAEPEVAEDDASESDTQDIELVAETPVVAEEEVAEALQTILEALAAPEPVAAPVGGIGLPDDSPFNDEFFAVEASWPYAPEPMAAANDGASAADEMASSYASIPSAEPVPVPMPERVVTPAPAPVAEEEPAPAYEDEPISMEDVLVSRLPAEAFDDSISFEVEPAQDFAPQPFEATPAFVPVAEPTSSPVESTTEAEAAPVVAAVAVAVAEPAPQLTLFAEPVVVEAPVSVVVPAAVPAAVDLTRLHAMEIDPLFNDAVNAILERGRASAVVLQRQLGIGYARGIRILDQMTAAGLVGPDSPTGTREIRVTKDAWAAFAAT